MISRHIASGAVLCVFAYLALATGGEKDKPSSSSDTPAPGAAPAAPAAPTAAPAAPAPGAYDAVGAQKTWGSIQATLKDANVKGKTGNVTLLLKNGADKEETISSLAQIQVTSEEGDKGDLDFMNSSCDGKIPPNGVLKCKLAMNFPAPPKELTIALGAGIVSETVYLKVKVAK